MKNLMTHFRVLHLLNVLPIVGFAQVPTPTSIIDQTGIEFVRIPAGSFEMGTAEPIDVLVQSYSNMESVRARQLRDETPPHQVIISHDFYLGKYEITVEQFSRFITESGYLPESIADKSGGYGYNQAYDQSRVESADAFEGRNPNYSWKNPGFPQKGSSPVTNVTWHDAMAMANWLSKKEGAQYRLPTEAEWEYACRAGSSTRYPNGDAAEGLTSIANTFDQDALPYWVRWHERALKGSDGFAFTAPVGKFAANKFGLHDMLGNVWEWVSDWYAEDYYSRSEKRDPLGPHTGTERVRRGGSWHTWSLYARCGFRNWNTPSSRYPLLGFRLVRE